MFVPSFVLVLICVLSATDADNYQVEEPTHCEVCKYFVVELQNRLEETGKSREILRTGHGLDTRNRKEFSYKTSELRLIEAMDGICEKILEYNVHKERTGSLRFSKGQSETMSTLHGLVNKGVKVELGIPYDLWDEPSVEVTILKKQCEQMLERHEESIEEWYFEHQDTDKLTDYLCKSVVLNKDNQSCLEEQWTGKEKKYQDEDQEDQGVVAERKKRKKRKKAAGKPKKEKKPKKGKSKGDNGSDSDSSDSPTSEKDEL